MWAVIRHAAESEADDLIEYVATMLTADVIECDVEGLATNKTGCTVRGLILLRNAHWKDTQQMKQNRLCWCHRMYCERTCCQWNRKSSDGNKCSSDTVCSNMVLTVDTMEWTMEGFIVNIMVAAVLGHAPEVHNWKSFTEACCWCNRIMWQDWLLKQQDVMHWN